MGKGEKCSAKRVRGCDGEFFCWHKKTRLKRGWVLEFAEKTRGQGLKVHVALALGLENKLDSASDLFVVIFLCFSPTSFFFFLFFKFTTKFCKTQKFNNKFTQFL
jgi:hypothetical protein